MEIRVDAFCSFKYRNVIATNPPDLQTQSIELPL